MNGEAFYDIRLYGFQIDEAIQLMSEHYRCGNEIH